MNSVMEHCSQALELNPRYTKALTRRLKVYESLGRKKDALLGKLKSWEYVSELLKIIIINK